jgi:hypothetical protein
MLLMPSQAKRQKRTGQPRGHEAREDYPEEQSLISSFVHNFVCFVSSWLNLATAPGSRPWGGGSQETAEGRSSFLKKRSKKLLFV